MTDILDLSKKELVQQCFDCCMQIVRSYGPHLEEFHRNGLITAMGHFKSIAERDIDKAKEKAINKRSA